MSDDEQRILGKTPAENWADRLDEARQALEGLDPAEVLSEEAVLQTAALRIQDHVGKESLCAAATRARGAGAAGQIRPRSVTRSGLGDRFSGGIEPLPREIARLADRLCRQEQVDRCLHSLRAVQVPSPHIGRRHDRCP